MVWAIRKKQMNSPLLTIDFKFLERNTNEQIRSKLEQTDGAGCLRYDFPECYNQSDVAWHYLEAAFIGQLLHSLDTKVKYRTEKTDRHLGLVYCFSFRTNLYEKTEETFEVLRDLMAESDEFACFDPIPELDDFIDSLGVSPVAFPDLIDSYYANHLGSSGEWLDEQRDETYSNNPEWAYQCWLSAESSKCGYKLYTSPRFWMMPAGVDFRTAIRVASDIDEYDVTLEKIETSFIFEGNVCLLGSGMTPLIRERFYLQLLEIASVIFPVEYEPGNSYWSRLPSPKHYLISKNRDFLVCEGDTFTYILFRGDFSLTSIDGLKFLRSYFEAYHKKLSIQAGLLLEYECNWKLLNDESFETLCYDLTRRDGRFAPSKTKKMGLAKSRDGGRDIVTYTHNRPRTTPQKWLIQCKHSLAKKSLGRNTVHLAELIDEYSPEGVIIATNLIVDSGLHDKAERIAKNRNVEIEIWDGLQIERLVNQHLDLFKRYFKNKTQSDDSISAN